MHGVDPTEVSRGSCAHCHPEGFAPVGLDLDLRWTTPLDGTNTVCMPTSIEATAGGGMRIDPAYPDDPVIVRRMQATTGDFLGLMPQVGRSGGEPRRVTVSSKGAVGGRFCPCDRATRSRHPRRRRTAS